MDYKLTARVLHSYYGHEDDVCDLVAKYADAQDVAQRLKLIVEQMTQQIKILEAENRLLKESVS